MQQMYSIYGTSLGPYKGCLMGECPLTEGLEHDHHVQAPRPAGVVAIASRLLSNIFICIYM